jgi:dihydrofolate synthase / folylpolyglutamate synthase
MIYKETIKYIFEAMPMFQRVGISAYKADLENAHTLDKYFNYPHHSFKSIHIAGTNGKGSVSHMLAVVFQTAGYKTGLFTSPHLLDFRERIKVNGKEISKKFVVDFIQNHKPIFDELKLSFFEMSVFMAFEYFRQQKIEVAIIETGLGGRLDTTNIITPELSVITNISKDHTQILGNTLEQIAYEKAGIIKNTVPVVIGESQNETREIFLDTANKAQSEICFADEYYKVSYQLKEISGVSNYYFSQSNEPELNPISSDLTGIYQKKNIATALMALSILRKNSFTLNNDSIKSGLKNVVNITGLRGRWQEISYNPLVVCDTGHNEAGIREILEQINDLAYKELHMILGFVSDKDLNAILALLPKQANYYLCEPKVARAKKVEELVKEVNFFNLPNSHYKNVSTAFKHAISKASKDDLIFVGGSNFVVADFIKWKKMKKTF